MKNFFHHTRLLFAGVVIVVFTAGCDTSEGFGRDLQEAGEAIEDAAQEAQEKQETPEKQEAPAE